jgi:hypothetical protein
MFNHSLNIKIQALNSMQHLGWNPIEEKHYQCNCDITSLTIRLEIINGINVMTAIQTALRSGKYKHTCHNGLEIHTLHLESKPDQIIDLVIYETICDVEVTMRSGLERYSSPTPCIILWLIVLSQSIQGCGLGSCILQCLEELGKPVVVMAITSEAMENLVKKREYTPRPPWAYIKNST